MLISLAAFDQLDCRLLRLLYQTFSDWGILASWASGTVQSLLQNIGLVYQVLPHGATVGVVGLDLVCLSYYTLHDRLHQPIILRD
jgi:hypothetical protein